jgi:hypothetical protein
MFNSDFLSGNVRRVKSLLLASVLCIGSSTATAAFLFEQAPLAGGDGFFSNIEAGAQNADSFTLSSAVELRGITWWGSYDPSADEDSFVVRILADSSGTPGGTVIALGTTLVTRTSTEFLDIAGAPVFQYDLTLALPVNLAAGSAFLSLANQTQSSSWFWLLSPSGNGEHAQRAADDDAWENVATGDFAFRLDGVQLTAVPVPGSVFLLTSGLIAACASQRLRRRRT